MLARLVGMAGGLRKAPQIDFLLGEKMTDSQDDFEKNLIAFDVRDHPTDFQSLLKLAEQGDRNAQVDIVSRYTGGRGGEQDDHKAFYWYHKLAEQNDAVAQFNIGCMYQEGRGVAPDVVQAYKWFKISAINKFEHTNINEFEHTDINKFKHADDELQKIKKQMTAEQITQAEKLAREWLQAYEKRRN